MIITFEFSEMLAETLCEIRMPPHGKRTTPGNANVRTSVLFGNNLNLQWKEIHAVLQKGNNFSHRKWDFMSEKLNFLAVIPLYSPCKDDVSLTKSRHMQYKVQDFFSKCCCKASCTVHKTDISTKAVHIFLVSAKVLIYNNKWQ